MQKKEAKKRKKVPELVNQMFDEMNRNLLEDIKGIFNIYWEIDQKRTRK